MNKELRLFARRRIVSADVAVATAEEALSIVLEALDRRGHQVFGFCNAHTVNVAQGRADFREALKSITLFNDGIGVDIASKLLYGEPFPGNLNGTDFTPLLLGGLRRPTKVYLLGSAPGVASDAAQRLADRFPNVVVVGARDGFFGEGDSAAIALEIRDAEAELVLVGMGHPRQEIWAAGWAEATGAVLLCVGAFLDFTAGRVPRAPSLARTLRIEWIFRLAMEPRRLAGRYLIGNITFLARVLSQRRKRGG